MVRQEPQDLLMFSVGPVQSFIAVARRTGDLWLGSRLLSCLALAGVQRADEEPGASLIYPRGVDGTWPQSIPNRFIVAVPRGRGSDLGVAMTRAVEGAWQAVADDVREFLSVLAPESGWEEIWERQIDNWLETYWVAWPWTGDDYGTAYRRTGLALDARKQIRNFPTSSEPGETCSLCGLREALHGRQDGRRHVRLFWNLIRTNSRVGAMDVREGEQLCAVCAIKRFAGRAGARVEGRSLQADRFPSTSSIAAATFKAALLENWVELRSLALAHLDVLDTLDIPGKARYAQSEESAFLHARTRVEDGAIRLLHYDGTFFYRQTFAIECLAELFGRDPTPRDKQQASRALRSLNALLDAAAERGVAPPHPYLAVLALDGDKMGELLSESQDPVAHGAISDALVEFAERDVPRVVELEHGGRVVYAGGDDVLALLPVAHALGAANGIRKALTNTLQGIGCPDRTASAGLVIMHHSHPLESALRAARKAEQAAKETYGRNALALEVLRRSGEETKVGLNWDYAYGPADALSIIKQVQAYFARDMLSGKISYDLRYEAPSLADLPGVHQAELARLLRRHWQDTPDKHRTEIETLSQSLAELCEKGRMEIEPLAEWLLVARFLAQGGPE